MSNRLIGQSHSDGKKLRSFAASLFAALSEKGDQDIIARNKPYSAACDNNRDPILGIISRVFANTSEVLEVGSGTGQHAVYFGEAMPWLTWRTSDLVDQHKGINAWVSEAGLENVKAPVGLNVDSPKWPFDSVDGIFSANTLHIVSWESVVNFFENGTKLLTDGGNLVIYGSFNYAGRYTSESNQRFDGWLKQRDTRSGVRDFEAVNRLAEQQGLKLLEDNAMPANNRLLVWRK